MNVNKISLQVLIIFTILTSVVARQIPHSPDKIDKIMAQPHEQKVRQEYNERTGRRFNDTERCALYKIGAQIYELNGETIQAQLESQRKRGEHSFWFIADVDEDVDEQLVMLQPRLVEVAIFPDPNKFFVHGTKGENLATQKELVKRDGMSLRQQLSVGGIDVIIPNKASTLTDLTFKYRDETGKWLFGPDYNCLFGITNNSVSRSDSMVAVVGNADPNFGLQVSYRYRAVSYSNIYAVRLVVPRENM